MTHGLRCRAFPHADQYGAVSDGHDIPTFDRRRAMILHRVAPPDGKPRVLEVGMEAIDRGEVQRLQPPRGPVHRVERDATVDPAGRVAGEDVVGQRREDEICRLQHRGKYALVRDRQFRAAHATNQDGRQQIGVDLHQVGHEVIRQTDPDGVVVDPRLQQPATGVHVFQRVHQQLPQIYHLDPAIAHRIGKGHVVNPRLLDPHHIIEQQLGAVGRSEPRHGGTGFVNQNAAQFARLGMDAVSDGHVGVPCRRTPRLRAAMTMIVRPKSTGQTKRNQRS